MSRSAQQAISTQKQYTETAGYLQQSGSSLSMTPDAWAGKLIREGKADAVVAEAVNNYGSQMKEAERLFDTVDPSRRSVAAALHTLAKNNDLGVLTSGVSDRDMYTNPRHSGELGDQPTSLQHSSFTSLREPAARDLDAETSRAGHSVNEGSFGSRFDSGNAAARDEKQVEAIHDGHNADVNKKAYTFGNRATSDGVFEATRRLEEKGKGLSDLGESVMSGIPQKFMNALSSAAGTRGNIAEYQNEGMRLGLDKDQAHVFAAARTGELNNNDRGAFMEYARHRGFNDNMASGMFDTLVQAGLNDNGSSAVINDIVAINNSEKLDREFVLGR